MFRIAVVCFVALAATFSALAQEYVGARDFLTTHEIDLIREAQESNARVETYLSFATLRIELIRQLLAKEEPGRGAKVHRNLEEYGRIIEAIDTVVDDAIVRDVNLEKTIEPLVAKENEFLTLLEKVSDDAPDDAWRFQFVLDDAVDVTRDSIEMSSGSFSERKRELMEAAAIERSERERSMSDTRRNEVQKGKKQQERKEEEFNTKRPTLMKKGEKSGEQKR